VKSFQGLGRKSQRHPFFLNFALIRGLIDSGFLSAFLDRTLSAMPGRMFEFPSGQTQQYGRERYGIPEVLFNPAISPWPLGKHVGARHPGSTISTPEVPLPLSHLLLEAIAASDIDIQPTLNANIIVTGASSLIPGLIDRLDFDLKAISPAIKFKISAPGNLVERKFAPWLGGSILASLGSFHQLWIGKDEVRCFFSFLYPPPPLSLSFSFNSSNQNWR
jgi:hypothetical protein